MPIATYVMMPPPSPGRRKIITIESELSAIGAIAIMPDIPLCASGRLGGSCNWISPSGISGPGRRAGRSTSTTLNAQLLAIRTAGTPAAGPGRPPPVREGPGGSSHPDHGRRAARGSPAPREPGGARRAYS